MAEPVRALVVDDEPLARERIRDLIDDRDDVAVVAEAGSGEEALSAVERHRPQLIFLDVQMPGMDGFEVLEAIDADPMPPVVFVTAFDRYAVRAFEVHALDYLLKPFDRDRFRDCVDRALSRVPGGAGTDVRDAALDIRSRSGRVPVPRFVVRSQGRFSFVDPSDVEWVSAEGNYVALHVGRRTHLVRATMKRMEGALDPRRFVRVHRSAIVNLDHVTEVRPDGDGDYVVTIGSGAEVTTGETYRSRVQELLKNPL